MTAGNEYNQVRDAEWGKVRDGQPIEFDAMNCAANALDYVGPDAPAKEFHRAYRQFRAGRPPHDYDRGSY